MKFLIPFLYFYIFLSNVSVEKYSEVTKQSNQEDLQIKALAVLGTRCNNCHATKKKQTVFTFENMDSLASDINKQLFIKQKMPKGKKNKLTEEESDALKAWLIQVLGP